MLLPCLNILAKINFWASFLKLAPVSFLKLPGVSFNTNNHTHWEIDYFSKLLIKEMLPLFLLKTSLVIT